MKEFRFFGFTLNVKNTLIGVGLYALLISFLLICHFFWFSVSWYGVTMGTGFLLAILVATKLMRERGLNKDFPYDLIWWIFPLSIIGARLYYVLFTPDLEWTFLEILDIRSGGLAIYGGIIGGTIGLIICCLIKKQNILKTIDVIAPCLILGQAIGRWGNFINQEAYGYQVTNSAFQWFPISVYIEEEAGWFLATFFYESLWNLIGFFLLVWALRKFKAVGSTLGLYLSYYGLGRVWIEGLRTDSLYIPNTGIRVSQLLSGILILAGIGVAIASFVIYNKKINKNLVVGKMRISDNLPKVENSENIESEHKELEIETETDADINRIKEDETKKE